MDGLCELVCSNSLRADRIENAVGLLKEEMRRCGSIVMRAADHTRVPAGGALAVDRAAFSAYVTSAMDAHPLIRREAAVAVRLPDAPAIVATGPLTDGALADDIAATTGGQLSFYDAAAPIVTADSLDYSKVYRAARYGRGGDDYINCPMSREEYEAFYRALIAAECAPVHGFEDTAVFEACMPVEVIAGRGERTLLFGPLRPVGLRDPRTGLRPFAVVQLRQENQDATMYNLVGFQTRLKHGEQQRVFRMIPGLENAQFARYGVMHRNAYLRSPGLLSPCFEVIARPGLFFAGQMTGVEGYVESAASGLVAGACLAERLRGRVPAPFPEAAMLGALGRYVSTPSSDYQPMHANMALLPALAAPLRGKKSRQLAHAQAALAALAQADASVQP